MELFLFLDRSRRDHAGFVGPRASLFNSCLTCETDGGKRQLFTFNCGQPMMNWGNMHRKRPRPSQGVPSLFSSPTLNFLRHFDSSRLYGAPLTVQSVGGACSGIQSKLSGELYAKGVR